MDRLLWFLYTLTYPTTHVAHTGAKDFITVVDDYAVAGREDLIHASMYCVGNVVGAYSLPDIAAKAFRKLGHGDGEFLKKNHWPELAAYIYRTSNPSERHLRITVIRELQWAMNHDRSLLGDGQVLDETLKNVPELATTPTTNAMYTCLNCEQRQYVLVLRCNHEPQHKARDLECSKLGLKEQECIKCHCLYVFETKEEEDDNDGSVDVDNMLWDSPSSAEAHK